MADTENREDQKISECLREAFGYSDDQLLKQLDQANETLKDVTFDGAEDRIMKRFLARKAEMEKESDTKISTNELMDIKKIEESSKGAIPELKEEKKSKKNIIWIGKKKIFAIVALVAVITGMLGSTAIGKKSYFFRRTERSMASILVDNDKNKAEKSKLEDAYKTISNDLGIRVLKMSYCPAEMQLEEVKVFKDQAQLLFTYNDNIISFFQMQRNNSASAKFKFDEKEKREVYNKWLNCIVEYSINKRDNNSMEYESLIIVNNSLYYLAGEMPEEEFERILQNLNFFE